MTRLTRNPETFELTIERQVNAAPEQAWEAWTRPEHVEQWWGPHEWVTQIRTMDVRPGGLWHYCMRARYDEDQMVWGRAIYREVKAPHLLTYTEAFCDSAANPIDGRERFTSVHFHAEDDATRLVIRTRYATLAEMEEAEGMGMEEGYRMTFDRLDTHPTHAT